MSRDHGPSTTQPSWHDSMSKRGLPDDLADMSSKRHALSSDPDASFVGQDIYECDQHDDRQNHTEHANEEQPTDPPPSVVWTETLASAVEAQRERQADIIVKIDALTENGLAFLDRTKAKFSDEMHSLKAQLCKTCEENEAGWFHLAATTAELQGRLHNAQDLVARLGIDTLVKPTAGEPF